MCIGVLNEIDIFSVVMGTAVGSHNRNVATTNVGSIRRRQWEAHG